MDILALKVGRKLLEWSGISVDNHDALAEFAEDLDHSTIPKVAAEVGAGIVKDYDADEDEEGGPVCGCGDLTHGEYVECADCGCVLCGSCDYRADNQAEPQCAAHRPAPTEEF